MIQIDHLSKKYLWSRWALDDVSLTLREGMVGLLGPNGAGKSTLMRILAALTAPTSGKATVFGIPLTRAEEIRRMIGYLPQQFQAYPGLTGTEYLDYVGALKGIKDKKRRNAEIDVLLEQVNLQDQAGKRVRTYSGGMKRRLGIAQALLGSPRVLIVDEPTAGLDPEERVRFRNLLTRFSLGRIVLLSTHIVADIERNCRQIAVLNQGKVCLSGVLDDLQECGRGKVWEARLSEREFARLDPLSVVSTRPAAGGLLCRIIGEAPPAAADVSPVQPSLEDGYLALLRTGLPEGAAGR
ncbi:ABC transporter ATP-binding protein [Paenibacillus oralis]|uniref:ABC transporter ATP-binding protein n=1 Tax=Paenibacillus oralis TaxID=2490856 RepID=A0A3P3TXD7_9BACL|nr:ABC transporter ATP-binding protein [Paenibacillus oralis]RRJ62039.1 ABC transporter ATP-binding protein [Paenibacillus oralis]